MGTRPHGNPKAQPCSGGSSSWGELSGEGAASACAARGRARAGGVEQGFAPFSLQSSGSRLWLGKGDRAGAGVSGNSAGEEGKARAAVSQLSVTFSILLAFGIRKAPVALATPLHLRVFACSPHQLISAGVADSGLLARGSGHCMASVVGERLRRGPGSQRHSTGERSKLPLV